MAIDLNRFIATFFDETQEHLESIEERAMRLAAGRHDAEILNAIFRAAHSIKGGAGTFAFSQLADAMHELETLFDGLRKGKGDADEATVRLVLDSCDVFKGHLARLQAGERGEDVAMTALHDRLTAYRGTRPAAPRAAQSAPTEESFFAAEPAEKAPAYGFFDETVAPTAPAGGEKF